MKKYSINQFTQNFLKNLNSVNFPYKVKVFGIFGLITYPGYYFIWHYLVHIGYENLYMRLIAAGLCVPLIFERRIPVRVKKYLGLYWHLTILYAMPFLFTYFLLKNNFSYSEVLNAFSVIVLTILLLETTMMVLTIIIGAALGWIYFTLLNPGYVYPDVPYLTIFISYGTTIVLGGLFTYKVTDVQQERIKGMSMVASSIAHEIRTPLATIKLRIQAARHKLSTFFQEAGANDNELDSIFSSIDGAEKSADNANRVINMLLLNLSSVENRKMSDVVSVNHGIEEALNNYPFKSGERDSISWLPQEDFCFIGSELLFIHVLYNLIKNALYFTAAKADGADKIIIRTDKKNHRVYFKDYGAGIGKKELGLIFDKFYTKETHHGSGVGLAFCKEAIELFGGSITCQSVLNEFTEFCIELPLTERE